MLTRILVVIAMAICLATLVAAPSRYTADEFRATIVNEHGLFAAVFGEHHAASVLERTDQLRRLVGGPTVHHEDGGLSAHGAPTQFNKSNYGQAVDAMLLLAGYRASYYIEFLPLLLPFLVVFIIDGLTTRSVRAREFLPHSPGVYGLLLFLMVAVLSGTFVAICLPWVVHPLWLMLSPVFLAFLAGRATANYHKHLRA